MKWDYLYSNTKLTFGIPLFNFGSMRNLDVFTVVAGNLTEVLIQPAQLLDHRVMQIAGKVYPALVKAPGHIVSGYLVSGLSQEALNRIEHYEDNEYAIELLPVRTEDGNSCVAQVYSQTKLPITSIPWNFQEYQRAVSSGYLDEVKNWMSKYADKKGK